MMVPVLDVHTAALRHVKVLMLALTIIQQWIIMATPTPTAYQRNKYKYQYARINTNETGSSAYKPEQA